METVAGIFESGADAEHAISQLRSLGLSKEEIVFLTPGTSTQAVEHAVPITESEAPGIGKAMGGAVGGALGAASGTTLGAAVATLIVPGVGPVIAAGILGAAILGIGGAAAGMAAGEAADESLAEGLPHDELFVYEDALRKGHSLVIALVGDEDLADRARNLLLQSGA